MKLKALYFTNILARQAFAFLAAASVIFLAVPLKGNASVSGPFIDEVVLASQIDTRSGKMSAGSFDDVMRAASADGGLATMSAAKQGPAIYHTLNVEFKSAAARQAVFTDQKRSLLAGATVLTVFDRFADIFIQNDAPWNALDANPNVLKVEYGSRVEAPPPPGAVPDPLGTAATPEAIIRGGYKGLTGKNVIIAVLDTGIDFRHPDFITYDAAGVPTSRIAYLWDTATPHPQGRGSEAPYKFPNGSSIGTLYTQAQLTAELRSPTRRIAQATDLDGHGTACASVAAGNGNADKLATGLKRTEVVGVAPEATIIGVRMGYVGFENGYLLTAIAEWLEKVAGKTPLVISGSFGGHYSGHDGQRVVERQLNARFPLTKAGRAVVFAAGNEGNDTIHAKANFAAEGKTVTWNARAKTYVKMYFDSAEKTISVSSTVPLGKNLAVSVNPITNQMEAQLLVEPGPGTLKFTNPSGKPVEAHLYFFHRDYGAFGPDSAVQSHLVASPGAMANAITVGSYDWNDNFHTEGKNTILGSVCSDGKGGRIPLVVGTLSCYSSPGPLRTGTVKPEIVAPGEWFRSASASDNGRPAGKHFRIDSTGHYRAMNGTSAATPYTSGVIALMFQKKPTMTLGELRDLLKANTTKSNLTPSVRGIPNNNWGYGKLDNAAIERIFGAL